MWQVATMYGAFAISGRLNWSTSHCVCATRYGSQQTSPANCGWQSGLSSPVSSPIIAMSPTRTAQLRVSAQSRAERSEGRRVIMK